MSVGVKYHYKHFIYPFVVEQKKYGKFLASILKNDKMWKFKIHNVKEDEKMYNFFLPYMRKFLFPTVYWSDKYKKKFKQYDIDLKSTVLKHSSCNTFEYDLNYLKNKILNKRRADIIDFDVTEIKLICFEPGICFFDIKAEIDEEEEIIDIENIIDFNSIFREITPDNCNVKNTNISVRSLDNINDIAIFIKSTIAGFESDNLENKYYDKLFTYTYVCLDKLSWSRPEDVNKIKNSFFKLQYNMDTKNTSLLNSEYDRINENLYSKWQYSLFGFSRESGLIMASEVEKYNITYMPHTFEKNYFYMLLLAIYQRISLINLSQELISGDKTKANKLQGKLTRFTQITWFSQITNSENGMDIWKKWKDAFELENLYEEVHRQCNEYYNMVSASVQDRISAILFIISIASVVLAGMQIVVPMLNIENELVELLVITLVIAICSIYPAYRILRWLKHRIKNNIGKIRR